MERDPADVVALLVALLAYVTSREVAHLLGPYAAIIVSASAGSALSLSATEKVMARWWQPMSYIVIRVGVAMVLTVAIAELAHSQMPELQTRSLLVPLAFGIGWMSDYNAVMRWIGAAIKKVIPGWLAGLGRKDG
jgi:hypothetical protein